MGEGEACCSVGESEVWQCIVLFVLCQGASNVRHAIAIATESRDDASVGVLLAHFVQESKETGREN